MTGRFAALALVLMLLAGLTGCGAPPDEKVVAIPTWDLEIGGRRVDSVTLPAHLEDKLVDRSGARAGEYTLHAAVPVPREMRGRDLTLVLPSLAARAHVIVDDHHVFAIDAPTFGGYREALPQRFRIPAERSDEGSIDVEIVVTNAWLPAAWVDAAPRLSATLDGDAATNRVRFANLVTSLAGTMATIVNAAMFGGLFLIDRRRRGYGWQGVQSLTAIPLSAFMLGITQRWFGVYDTVAMGVSLGVCAAASVEYTYAQFDLGRPRRAVWLIAIVPALASVVAPGPFVAPKVVVPIVLVAVTFVLVPHVAVAVRAWRQRPRSWPLVVSSLAWPVGTLAAYPDCIWWLGYGDPAHGLRGAALATVIVAVVQAATLLHAHAASLRRADDLNVELAERVRALEESNVEVKSLNDELRRQIGARSEKLAESLARSSAIAQPLALRPGDVIEDRYRVVRELGAGGMGAVYLVERIRDARRFALKIQTSADSPEALARLAREAQLASQVAHPNIVAVVDVDVSQSGVLYIVMEHVDGKSLADMHDRFGDVAWAMPILRQIADGLAAIHAKSIVHRDMKPGNVLVAGDAAKIADFGISARAREWSEPDELATTLDAAPQSSALTLTGAVMGTPLYMAPEAARGARYATAASDVFSFGVIAFEVLSGKLPFDAAEVVARLRGRSSPAPSLRAVCTHLDGAVVEIVERCLLADPAARPTAAEIARALHRGAEERTARA